MLTLSRRSWRRVERRFLLFLGALAVYLPVLLLPDSPGLLPQLALGTATVAIVWLFVRRGPIEPRQIVTVIIVATIGECVLSLGWGLYRYRNTLIPLYVPFGHGIFYALAAESAHQSALRRIGPALTRGVLAAGSILAGCLRPRGRYSAHPQLRSLLPPRPRIRGLPLARGIKKVFEKLGVSAQVFQTACDGPSHYVVHNLDHGRGTSLA